MYAADVTKAVEVERMVETAIQRYGRLDILSLSVDTATAVPARSSDLRQ